MPRPFIGRTFRWHQDVTDHVVRTHVRCAAEGYNALQRATVVEAELLIFTLFNIKPEDRPQC